MRLKSRSKEEDHRPVVDGERVEPYELPDDPVGNERQLDQIAEDQRRRSQAERTQFSRAASAVAAHIRARKGPGFERTFFGRWTVEWRRPPTRDGRARSLEITCVDRKHMRGVQWNFIIELWRAK